MKISPEIIKFVGENIKTAINMAEAPAESSIKQWTTDVNPYHLRTQISALSLKRIAKDA